MLKHTDFLSVIGIALGVAVIVAGNALEGTNAHILVNGPAALIVLGGTVAAIFLQTPFQTLVRSLKALKVVFVSPGVSIEHGIEKITGWSRKARTEGLLGLEDTVTNDPEPFCRKGGQLLVDGAEPNLIRDVLDVDMRARSRNENDCAKVFDAMAAYSPAIGLIATVIGVIDVVCTMEMEGVNTAENVASTVVAIIYGVGFSALLWKPIANKIRNHNEIKTRYYELVKEGVVSIAEGESSRTLEIKLQGYAPVSS